MKNLKDEVAPWANHTIADAEFLAACEYLERKCGLKIPRDFRWQCDIIAWAADLRACDRCKSRVGFDDPGMILYDCHTHGFFPRIYTDEKSEYKLYAQYKPCDLYMQVRKRGGFYA